jgi:DNA-binding NtrC family response regulator
MRAPFDLNILIVDDDCDIRERFTRFLTRRGYNVLTAENGLDGLQVVRDNNIDIIYCDITMPKMDGLEFLEQVRKINIKAEIIMVTGTSTVERCINSIEHNAHAYLLKPLRLDTILEHLTKAVERVQEKKNMLKTALLASKEQRDRK